MLTVDFIAIAVTANRVGVNLAKLKLQDHLAPRRPRIARKRQGRRLLGPQTVEIRRVPVLFFTFKSG